MSRYAEPMARLIEELKKLPGVGTKSRSGSPSIFCARPMKMRRRWPRLCAG